MVVKCFILVKTMSQQQHANLKIYFESNCKVNTTKFHLFMHEHDIHYSLGLKQLRRWSTELVRFDISVDVIDPETSSIAFQRSFKFVN